MTKFGIKYDKYVATNIKFKKDLWISNKYFTQLRRRSRASVDSSMAWDLEGWPQAESFFFSRGYWRSSQDRYFWVNTLLNIKCIIQKRPLLFNWVII